MTMWEKVSRIAIALTVVSALSFVLSWLLLAGEDPAGWWNYVPAFVFYATSFVLVPGLGLVALVALALSTIRRHHRAPSDGR